jgi:hypothetical protein
MTAIILHDCMCMTGGIFFFTPAANLFCNIYIYLLWLLFFKLLGQTVCVRHTHAK